MQVYAEKCRPVKSRQISAVRSGSLQVDLYLPRLWEASGIKDFIWPDCKSEVRSAAGRAASEHCVGISVDSFSVNVFYQIACSRTGSSLL